MRVAARWMRETGVLAMGRPPHMTVVPCTDGQPWQPACNGRTATAVSSGNGGAPLAKGTRHGCGRRCMLFL